MADSVVAAGAGFGASTDALAIPSFKGRPGWEFTDLSSLNVNDYRLLDPVHPVVGFGALGAGTGAADVSASASGAVAGTASALWQVPAAAAELPAGVSVTNEADGTTVVRVARGTLVADPLYLTTVQSGNGTILNQSVRVIVEEGADAEIWEQYLSVEPELDAIFNARTELLVGDGARLRYVTGQALSERSWIFGAQRAEVGRSAVLDWIALGFGSRSGHVLMNTRLTGEGAEARVTGAYATHGRQHIDFDTTQEHAAPNTVSDLAFRGVLQDRSSAVWKGNIIVDPGAQKTDAFQDSRNLLISKKAHADSIPGLEIQANDVRCTHAAAVAQVDPEQLFYLMARGIPEAEAKQLVIEGFLAALVERFEAGAVRDVLGSVLEHRLAAIL